jgi:hypothetical protein
MVNIPYQLTLFQQHFTRPLSILVGCEESQVLCSALRYIGHESFSCDLLPCSGDLPEFHLQMDIFQAINLKSWDAALFFPPCTYLTNSANRWYKAQPTLVNGSLVGIDRLEARKKAIDFFIRLYNCSVPMLCVENPVGVMNSFFRKPNQVIHPYMFGDDEQKTTCLWLKNLPKLQPLTHSNNPKHTLSNYPDKKGRQSIRSKTFKGIAQAMATQWFTLE